MEMNSVTNTANNVYLAKTYTGTTAAKTSETAKTEDTAKQAGVVYEKSSDTAD